MMKLTRIFIVAGAFAAPAAHAQISQIFGTIHTGQYAVTQAKQSLPQQGAAQQPVPQSQPAGNGSDSPTQAVTQHLGGSTPSASTNGNPPFGMLFGCAQPARTPLLSAFALHDIKLGDVCAQPELTTGEPQGMVSGVENDMRRLAPTDNIAVTRLTGSNTTVSLATLRASARPPELAKSVVIAVEEHVKAADVTNSLQPGNSFRVALEQRYGKPSTVIGAREKLAADHKTAAKGIESRAKALGIESREAITKSVVVEDRITQQWVACHPADTVYALRWANPDGTVLVASLADGECGARPSFDLSLMPNLELPKESQFLIAQWTEPALAYSKAQTQARSVSASTPKF
ncbi:hypothetical protein B0G81_6483 [Paraburkholderia sp. BL6665CI2N2]|uniref:hypothetical protein n=1 Tax=Paraburkholderia sp. BL6665CI2N2 TaxID=1938806 RepID=UPI001066F18A|nr:hypothetical protein [Paraburkholderia sp. BL6665CI2N2]TDY25986.1 hypothetical protein B0G81_6483 [Paraburkholderia sp. BL6665CI2N2]